MTPHLVDTRRGTFGCFAEGAPEAPLILFLHGFPDSAHAWRPVLRSVAARGYRAVAPFLRGYAPSVLEGPYTLEELAEDVRALADALGAPRFSLVGHDWGAVITYAAASAFPERIAAAVTLSVPHPVAFAKGLVTSAAQLRRSWYMAFFQLPLAERRVAANDFAFIDRLFARWSPDLRPEPSALAAVKAALAPGFPAALEYYRAALRPLPAALDRVRGASLVRVPTLHLTGADDGCIGPEVGRDQHRWFAAPFATEILPGVGHFVQWERPEWVATRVVDWVRAHAA